jgi:L-asparaginase II
VTNPIITEVIRGGIVESAHRGAYVVMDTSGKMVTTAGDVNSPIFPRSAIKAFQCLPVITSGAADAYGLSAEELALCCASHDGEEHHVRVARAILAKAGISEHAYECGAHWPSSGQAARELAKQGGEPQSVHNNCSGKHAGMLALAKHMGAPLEGYTSLHHAVQRAIAQTLADMCDFDVETTAIGIDGCSVPTWAVPLRNLAQGFARLTLPSNIAGHRIINAVREHPLMVGGTKNFDTRTMQQVPRVFLKVGAEGVYCGCVPHAGLGFALKCDDGGIRAAEAAVAGTLSRLQCWTESERECFAGLADAELRNWRGISVGRLTASL